MRTDSGELLYYEGVAYREIEGGLGASLPRAQLGGAAAAELEILRATSLPQREERRAADLRDARRARVLS